jgi:hypothetical protein
VVAGVGIVTLALFAERLSQPQSKEKQHDA